MTLETGDKVRSATLGDGVVLKAYDGSEIGVRFSDGEYVIPESSVEFMEKGERQPCPRPSGKGSRYDNGDLTEDQEAFLALKTATAQEVQELCEGEKSIETIQRNIRALRPKGYVVSQTLNEDGFAEYSLLPQEKGHVVNSVKQQDVLDWWKAHAGQWLHDKDTTLGLGLSINKQCAVALARRVLTAAGHPFHTRQLEDSRKFQFCYIGEKDEQK